MSHHSDEALLVAGSDSFWEPGNYKRTSKRTEDGHRLCADLVQLVQERSEVEKAYAKGLRAWARKWADLIDKGPEYGTTEAAWKGALLEAERTSEMHLRVRDRLLNDVVPQVCPSALTSCVMVGDSWTTVGALVPDSPEVGMGSGFQCQICT